MQDSSGDPGKGLGDLGKGNLGKSDLGKALAAFRNNQPALALRDVERLLNENPEHGHANALKGTILAAQGNAGMAITFLEKALTLLGAPDGALLFNLGRAYQQVGKRLKAKTAFEHAVSCAPDNTQAWFMLARIYQNQDDLEACLHANAQVIRLSESHSDGVALRAGALVEMAKVHLKRKDSQPAKQALDEAARDAPRDPRVHLLLGDVYRLEGEHGLAVESYLQAHELYPNSREGFLNASTLLIHDGELDRAALLLERAMQGAREDRKIISAYSTLLWEMGRDQEYDDLLDYSRFVSATMVENAPSGYDSLTQFHHTLIDDIRNHPTLRGERTTKSTIGGLQTGDIFVHASPAIASFMDLVNRTIEHYISDAAHNTGEPGTVWSEAWNLIGWGVILHSQGYQSPHNHPSGMVSGVYYLQVPTEVDLTRGAPGCIEFGPPNEKFGVRREPPRHHRLPREGMMVLFPSHYWHRTVPFESGEERICIAFDAIPLPRSGAFRPPGEEAS